MTTMLGKMSESKLDNFNIILFDDAPRSLWSSQIVNGIPKLSFSISENNGNVGPIYDMILDLNTGGSTNINDALLKAKSLYISGVVVRYLQSRYSENSLTSFYV